MPARARASEQRQQYTSWDRARLSVVVPIGVIVAVAIVCIVVAVRGPEDRLLRKVIDAVDLVQRETGLEVACSLGLHTSEQAERLAAAVTLINALGGGWTADGRPPGAVAAAAAVAPTQSRESE